MVFNYSSVPWMWSYWRTSVAFQWFHHRKANRYRHPPSSSPFYPPSSSSSTPAARPRTLHQLRRRFLRALGGSKSSHHLKNSQHTTRNYKSPNNTDNMKTLLRFFIRRIGTSGKVRDFVVFELKGLLGFGLENGVVGRFEGLLGSLVDVRAIPIGLARLLLLLLAVLEILLRSHL